MRDPARIDRILGLLRAEWEKNPDMRLCQLLVNATGCTGDMFHISDDVLEAAINRYADAAEAYARRNA